MKLKIQSRKLDKRLKVENKVLVKLKLKINQLMILLIINLFQVKRKKLSKRKKNLKNKMLLNNNKYKNKQKINKI